MPYRPQRPPRQGVPPLGVILMCAASLMAGCVGGAALASPADTGTVSATSSPSASSTATATPHGNGTEGDDDDRRKRTPKPKRTTSKPKPKPRKTTRAPSLDRRYPTCAAANRAGHGPYIRGIDPEYHWYQDRDHDGRVCERR